MPNFLRATETFTSLIKHLVVWFLIIFLISAKIVTPAYMKKADNLMKVLVIGIVGAIICQSMLVINGLFKFQCLIVFAFLTLTVAWILVGYL